MTRLSQQFRVSMEQFPRHHAEAMECEDRLMCALEDLSMLDRAESMLTIHPELNGRIEGALDTFASEESIDFGMESSVGEKIKTVVQWVIDLIKKCFSHLNTLYRKMFGDLTRQALASVWLAEKVEKQLNTLRLEHHREKVHRELRLHMNTNDLGEAIRVLSAMDVSHGTATLQQFKTLFMKSKDIATKAMHLLRKLSSEAPIPWHQVGVFDGSALKLQQENSNHDDRVEAFQKEIGGEIQKWIEEMVHITKPDKWDPVRTILNPFTTVSVPTSATNLYNQLNRFRYPNETRLTNPLKGAVNGVQILVEYILIQKSYRAEDVTKHFYFDMNHGQSFMPRLVNDLKKAADQFEDLSQAADIGSAEHAFLDIFGKENLPDGNELGERHARELAQISRFVGYSLKIYQQVSGAYLEGYRFLLEDCRTILREYKKILDEKGWLKPE